MELEVEGEAALGGSSKESRAPGAFSATATGDVGTAEEDAEVKV